nr:hypothetical protein [Neorhizobium tomejilense]
MTTQRMSGALRAKLHRERKRNREVQVAVGLAKLVLGQSAGEQRKVIIEVLEKANERGDLPGDYARTLDRAIDNLTVGSLR